MVENYLRSTGYYHVFRIGVIRGFYLLLAVVERWRPETHTFVLSVGEVTVILEDVAHIFGLPIDGELVSGWTDSNTNFIQSQSIVKFGREPEVSSSSKSYIKLGWVRSRIRDAEPLDIEESIRSYIRCQIFYLLGLTLDKPLFHGLSCAQLSGFYQLFTHLFILFAWFYICLSNYVL
ncbi:hypothetical protein AHAS_Ahas07G0075300 [Arachis hypogaea]